MTEKRAVRTFSAPSAIGPYEQAVRAGDFIFCSGQIALNPDGELVGGDDVAAQAEQVLSNLRAVLNAGGSDLSRVVKTTVFLASMDDYKAVNEVYARYFSAPYPARAAVAVRTLPKKVKVEIDAIATLL